MRVAFGKYQLDTETRTLQLDGRRIPVQSKAFDLLAYLIERRERMVSIDELLDALWPGLHVTPAALSRAVQKARQAVGDDGEHQTVIHTEHGKGFRFVAEVADLSPAKTDDSPARVNSARTFDLTPEEIERQKGVELAESVARATRRKLTLAVIALVAIAVVYFAADHFFKAESGPVSVAPAKSIAVLPFDNISPDPEDAYVADGMHDEVLAELSKIRDLTVISRTSVMRYSVKNRPSLREIAANLGVANILEGSVRLAGNQVRITAQLIEAQHGTHLWTQTYERELTAVNIFSIQSDVAKAVVNSLHATLSHDERKRLAVAPTQSLDAYQAYLLGRQQFDKMTTESLKRAIESFERAVELDPGFALAYVGLADSYGWLSETSDQPWEEMLTKAQAAVDEALALDDQLGEAYNALSGIRVSRNDYEDAEAAAQRALELNPGYARAYFYYGILLMRRNLDRPAEALPLLRKAVELDPLSTETIMDLGRVLLDLNRAGDSAAWFQRALEVDPSSPVGHRGLGFYHMFLGQLDEACRWFAKGAALDPGDPSITARLGLIFLDLGDLERADYWSRRSLQFGPEVFWPNIAAYLLDAYQGNEAAGLSHARKAYARWPLARPALSLLRDHEIAAGRYAAARALYEATYPELLEDDPEVMGRNWQAAIDLALILQKTGEAKRADRLLQRSLEHLQTLPPRGANAEIAEVQIYALRGDPNKALSALRQAIDQGWRSRWWYSLRHDPNLASLHAEPAYQAMLAEIEADMATQLARVREMEQDGELEQIPAIATE